MPRPRISNLQVTGSNPVGRAKNSNHHQVVLIFAIRPWMRTCKVRNVSWRERVLTKFESYVVKGTHRAQANMGIYNPVGRARNSNPRQVVLFFVDFLFF